jgi:beta-galactosidase
VAWRDGDRWAEARVQTTGDATRLAASADRASIVADGRDLAFVTVRIVDANGLVVPTADHRVRFRVSGGGDLVATDNGDPTDMTAFPSAERSAFNGVVLGIVRATPGARDDVRVAIESPGLAGTAVTLQVE